MKVQFTYEVDPDEFGVGCGLDGIRAHVVEALSLAAPYSDGCLERQAALFMAVAMQTMLKQQEEARREGGILARLLTTYHRPGRWTRRLEAGHIWAMQLKVDQLLGLFSPPSPCTEGCGDDDDSP